jgi:hypothetical protein
VGLDIRQHFINLQFNIIFPSLFLSAKLPRFSILQNEVIYKCLYYYSSHMSHHSLSCVNTNFPQISSTARNHFCWFISQWAAEASLCRSWNPAVRYLNHKSPTFDSFLGQPNLVNTLKTIYLKIRLTFSFHIRLYIRKSFSSLKVFRRRCDNIYLYLSDYGLDDRAIGVRSLAGAEDFSCTFCVQTGSGAHPDSCTVGTGGKARPGRDADHSSLSSAEVVNE